jgi:hypothetical protein
MQQDVPYLPELVRVGPDHFMIPSALSGELPAALGAFVKALEARGPKFAKAQLAGPRSAGVQWTDHLAKKAAAMARALKTANVTPMLFFDEPALGMGELPAAELAAVRRVASEEGAIVGVHCCGQTRWSELLGLGFDVVSLDARLSLEALLEDRPAWLSFLERGGTLCLGVIPTSPGARYDVGELCDSIEASLRATTPQFERVLSRMMLSPACGLGLHSAEDALRISAEVKQAQVRLRALL